jgi:uncharacterized membrane protein YgaE (UPF0421/DUF939 family)
MQPTSDDAWSGRPRAALKTRQGAGSASRLVDFGIGVLIGGIVVLLVWLLL